MKEFQSQLEQLLSAEELLFDSTPGFGRYKPFMEQAIAHPAKMNTRLLEFLIKTHTKEGDVVLDPMAGSGSTGIVSALHGRNAINIELEEKFYQWIEDARRKVENSVTLAVKGKICNIKGDARQLSKLLVEADVVLTSPPYANTISKQGGPSHLKQVGISTKTSREYSSKLENLGNLSHGDIDAVITSPPYGEAQDGSGIAKKGYQGNKHSPTDLVGKRSYMPDKFESKENISCLSMGDIDAIITSPPYSETLSESKNTTSNLKREERLRTSGHEPKRFMGGKARDCQLEDGLRYSHTPANIGNLKHGKVDAVITSPPYAEVVHSTGQTREKVIEMLRKKGYSEAWIQAHYMGPYCQVKETGYSENPENIGNLGFVDSVITSPPYHDNKSDWDLESRAAQEGEPVTYSDERGERRQNIGNIHYFDEKEPLSHKYSKAKDGTETYLEAMLKVYAEMCKVLKPEGSAIIVIKPFIRNKKVVDLPWHTWLLLEKVGFKLTKLYKLRLKQDSFWRILYKQKYPDVPQIKHEYVLVCQKSPSFYAKGEELTNLFREKDLKTHFQSPKNKPQTVKQARIGKTEISMIQTPLAETSSNRREPHSEKPEKIHVAYTDSRQCRCWQQHPSNHLLRGSCKSLTVNRL